jgi:hypothetical protein
LKVKLKISPRLIPSVASLYDDINRIFMEYIDNALDSAEQFFDREKESYLRPVRIQAGIHGNTHKFGRVTIQDNCAGIANIAELVESIGNSGKKAQPWTNGQFGYGIYAFMEACGRIEVSSKTVDAKAVKLPIRKSQFDADNVEEVEFNCTESRKFPFSSGTVVEMSGFERARWKQINPDDLKTNVEKHFELLLGRRNISIEIGDSQGRVLRCLPFDYDKYAGEEYDDEIKALKVPGRSKFSKEYTLRLPRPVRVFIKVTRGAVINKPPIFILKGRKIAEIKDVRSLRSSHKGDLWGHPNVTGFVDLGDFLEPMISRNDFKDTDKKRALFRALLDLEPLILSVVEDERRRKEERHYKELEDRLNQALSELARSDSIHLRTVYQPVADGGVRDEERGPLPVDIPPARRREQTEEEGGRTPERSLKGNQGQSGFEPLKRKRPGLNIRIVDMEPDVDEETGRPLRSTFIDDEIWIFRQHPDFEERVERSRKGEAKVSEKLINYLSCEVGVHYRDKYWSKEGQSEYQKKIFVDFAGFVYRFEKAISDLKGKDLSGLYGLTSS